MLASFSHTGHFLTGRTEHSNTTCHLQTLVEHQSQCSIATLQGSCLLSRQSELRLTDTNGEGLEKACWSSWWFWLHETFALHPRRSRCYPCCVPPVVACQVRKIHPANFYSHCLHKFKYTVAGNQPHITINDQTATNHQEFIHTEGKGVMFTTGWQTLLLTLLTPGGGHTKKFLLLATDCQVKTHFSASQPLPPRKKCVFEKH